MFDTITRTLTRRRADRELTRILRDADPRRASGAVRDHAAGVVSERPRTADQARSGRPQRSGRPLGVLTRCEQHLFDISRRPLISDSARTELADCDQRSSKSSAAPACARLPSTCSSSHTARARSTQTTTRSPGLARSTATCVASISSSTTSICLTLAPSRLRLAARPARSAPAVSPWRPAAQPLVLPDDDPVEVLGGLKPEIDHVLVAAVAGGGDDADPLRALPATRRPRRTGRRSRRARPSPARCGSSRR